VERGHSCPLLAVPVEARAGRTRMSALLGRAARRRQASVSFNLENAEGRGGFMLCVYSASSASSALKSAAAM